MKYTPEHLERWAAGAGASGWDSAANYSGEDLSGCYVAPIHRTRDTEDALTLSNFRVIEAELDQLVGHEESGLVRIGHWACGWFEIYLIHESDSAALECADQWACSLADYPVAREDDLSELEVEHESEAWDAYGSRQWADALTDALDQYTPEDADCWWGEEIVSALSEDQLYTSWHELTERCGWHCQHESDGPRFNIDDPAKLLTAEVLGKLTGLALLPPDQEWRREPYPWAGADPSPLAPSLPVGS
jgi:hypothetical protein